MRKIGVLVVMLGVFASASVSRATFIGTAAPDGVAVTGSAVWDTTNPNDLNLTVTGTQYATPGQVLGGFGEDTPGDPTIAIRNSIDNDSGFSWTGYLVDVTMDKAFTLSNPTVYAPGDWTSTITQQPQQVGSNWVGQIDYAAGTPVDVSGTLDFGYKATFAGGTQYTFCQSMTPVPEPGTLALLACGLLAAWGVRRRCR